MTLRARKSLGQHFLRNRALLGKIAAVTQAGARDVVLEIGPGEGTLTTALLDRGCVVVAIERDERLGATLQRAFRGRPLALVMGDAMELDWPALVAPWTVDGYRWHVAGNIPYNITSPLLDKALSQPLPASVTYLVQREVAERVVAAAGSEHYGALSVGIQAVANPTIAFGVDRGAFVPPPRVDSAVLHLVPRDVALVPPEQIAPFRRLVTSLFSYRRKRMARALREARGLSADDAVTALAAASIDPDVRPEVVRVEEFVRLLAALSLDASSRLPSGH